ncbi:MAG: HAMP domain-containing protein [Chloroflexi bacterium]|nr:MAG: HAMP domain-containing protein [Chloroflexota bacterium]
MAKTRKPNEDEKIVKENVQKRFKNMFSGENQPLSNLSLQEVEALQTRVAELEAQLEGQPATPTEYKPVMPVVAPALQSPSGMPARKTRKGQHEPAVTAALQKRIGLWVTGISAAVGLAFFVVALYIVFDLQGGMMELSDIVLMPFTVLMFIANLIGWRLVQRNRPVLGVWISYLTNVILAPVLVVLVLKNFYVMMIGYLAIFSLLFIVMVLPKTSRRQAILAAIGAALVIAGIEAWNPAFRLGTSHIQNFTLMVLGPAAVGILVLFITTQQLRNPRIQTRLTALIMVVIIPLLLGISILVTSLARTRIEAGANTELLGTSRGLASIVSTWLELNSNALQGLTLQPGVFRMNAHQQQPVLQAMAEAYPYMYLVSTTNLDGFNIARNDNADLTDYSDRDWFKGASAGSPVTYQSLIGRTTGKPALVVSMPIRTGAGNIVGVGMFAADLTDLAEETKVSTIGERGFTYIVDANNQALAHPDPTYTAELRDMSDYPPVAALRQGQTGLITFTDENGDRWRAYATTLDNGWAVIAQRPESEILAPARQFQIVVILLVVAGGGIMLALAWVTIRRTLQPIATLTSTISAISAGDLSRVIEVKSEDEIGVLASTFNNMTNQLRGLIGSLEGRVAERTHDLELAAEIGRTVTERVTQLSEMLTEAAEIIRARFDLYYSQIYLTDPSGERIILRAGTGEVGKELLQRGHHLLVNSNSLNGRAVVEKQAQIVADTNENPKFLPNPLLPNTRSEMSVPLIVDGKVVGVLDVQSERPGALSESNLPAFEALAGQLAIAIRNAALFTEVQEARSEVESQISRFTKQGWQDFLDAIRQGHRIGFAFNDSQVIRLKPEILTTISNADCLNLPITVTGTKVGAIQLPANLKANELQLVKSVSEQLAQHVENLRLLAQAEQYRAEAEEAVQRLTHEGWASFLQTQEKLDPGYVFDLIEVKPLSEKSNDPSDYAVKQPMTVGDQVIGELAVDNPDPSAEVAEVVAAIAQQLSGHIENLRLSELNEKHAQREQTLRQITGALRSSNDPATILRTAVRELGTIMGRRAVVQLTGMQRAKQPESTAGNENESNAPANHS